MTSCSSERPGVAQHHGAPLPATSAIPGVGNGGERKGGSKAALDLRGAALLPHALPTPEPHGSPGARKETAPRSPSFPGDSCCPVMPTARLPHQREVHVEPGTARGGHNRRRRSQDSVSTPSPTPPSFLQCASLHIGAGTEGRQSVPGNKSGADYFPAGAMRKP